MAFLNMLDKVDDFFYKPMETICNWLEEPLKHFAHNRSMTEEEKKHELERIDREHAAQLELDMEKAKLELEELRKDKDFKRNKELAEVILNFNEDMANICAKIKNDIGNMTLEMRDKATKSLEENTTRFKKLMKEAQLEAAEEFKQIDNDFSQESEAYKILSDGISTQLKTNLEHCRSILEKISDDYANVLGILDSVTKDLQGNVNAILTNGVLSTPALDGNGNEVRPVN